MDISNMLPGNYQVQKLNITYLKFPLTENDDLL